jgi:glycosyltransferase involved in cell wall biosynthesis
LREGVDLTTSSFLRRGYPPPLAATAGPQHGLDDLEIAACGIDWFNDERLHSELEDHTPAEVEAAYYQRACQVGEGVRLASGTRTSADAMAKRIMLLTQWFEPEPTLKGLVFARELIRRGYEVEVVTGFPNYPGGQLYPGYRISWRQREVIDGVQVTRLPLYPSHDASAIRRIANYMSFALSAGIYCLFKARRTDTIYVYQLPTLGGAAAVVKAVRGSRVVLDVTDIWPDTLSATDMVRSDRLLRAVGGLAQWVYRRVDAVVALSPGFRRLLIDRGVPPHKVHLIYNWCDERSLSAPRSQEFDSLPRDGKFNIVFAGNMGKAQGLTAVLDAAARLMMEAPDIRFVFIGGGVESEQLKAIAQDRGLTNVLFVPRVRMDKVGVYLEQADALLVHLKADPLFTITIPAKTQAYMAMGKPVLMATAGDAASLVREARCGVEALPENPESIASAARQLAALPRDELAAMGRRAKTHYTSHLSLSAGIDKFVSVFEAVSTK